jgi:ABC-type nitrate/sulfonate/bicarbonate transport system ATPase subunit
MRRCAGSHWCRPRAKQFIRRVGLRDFAHEHRHELSGGRQPRATIVCTLFVERFARKSPRRFRSWS